MLPGSCHEPDAAALALARELPVRYPALRSAIEKRLVAHYEAFREARERDDRFLDPLPRIDTPSQVWSQVTVDHIRVAPIDGVSTIEIALEPARDVDDGLRLRLHDWHWIELASDA